MTDKLAELRAMERVGTPAPWDSDTVHRGTITVDIRLMFAARNALPALLDVAEAAAHLVTQCMLQSSQLRPLRAALARLEES